MLMTAFLDLSAFDGKYFDDDCYVSWAKQFLLEMITENGLFLTDRGGERLQACLSSKILSLPTQYRSFFQAFFDAALKSPSRFINIGDFSHSEILETVRSIQKQYSLDAIFASPDNVDKMRNQGIASHAAHSFLQYPDSEFQLRRRSFRNDHYDLGELEAHECKEVFIRTIRFARHLGIYDRYLGQGGRRTRNFCRGIDFILGLWQEHGYFAANPDTQAYIDFYTSEKHWNTAGQLTTNQLKENEKAIEQTRSELIERLEEKYSACNWKMTLHVKQDPDKKMHARYLDAQFAVLDLNSGFDLFDEKGGFRSNQITFKTGGVAVGNEPGRNKNMWLQELQHLPEARTRKLP